MDSSHCPNTETAPETRKSWEEPRIVLERLLLVSAQDGRPKDSSLPFKPMDVNPGGPSFMGPLGTSGGSGNC